MEQAAENDNANLKTDLTVNLSERSYPIEIGSGNLSGFAAWLKQLTPVTHAAVITDSNVLLTHGNNVVQQLVDAGIRTTGLGIEAGEASKSISVADHLWNKLLEEGGDRKTVVVAVGGGVVGDLAGFIAATFGRGVPFVQVPTTLLAQVDSSVGGKVGVNLPNAKNMVGAFWQPVGVLIDTDTLSTLADREFISGLGEVVKYGVILDAEFFTYLEEHAEAIVARDPAALRHIVARSCQLKADVVEADERETTGLRAVLNYGHTFCHAIESVGGYGTLLHGEAVSIGMMCAARLAASLGRIEESMVTRQEKLLTALQLPVEMPDLDRNDLLEAMNRDKKVEHGKLRFVLPTKMGHVELVGDVEREATLAAMK